MLPEAILVLILIITFICDFISANRDKRPWFNPLVSSLMALYTLSFVLNSEFRIPNSELFGGMYVSTEAGNIMKLLLAFGTLIVLLQAKPWLSRTDTAFKEGEFYMIIICTLLGMNMMVSAGHFLTFFLGLETASVPMACLVAFDKFKHHSAEAGAKYILTATFSSAVMLFGISLIYAATGTLYFADVATKLQLITLHSTFSILHSPFSILALVFFFTGLGFKISLVPFHFWTADTYQGAPTVVTGYLSVISKGAATFTLMTILMKVFGSLVSVWEPLLYIVIVASIVLANIMAIRQTELKRFMAFSSISQAGYIMLAVIGNNAMSISALSYYVLVYIVANLAVFTIISAVEEHNGGDTNISALNGFYTTNPKLALLMTLALFSLAGIPPFAGMFSKFFVFMAALKAGSIGAYIVVFIALINTVVSLYYYLLIVKAMYINKADAGAPADSQTCRLADADNTQPATCHLLPATIKSPLSTKLALTLSTAGVLLCGIISYFWEYINI